MEMVESEFDDGVRRPDSSRWDLARLAKVPSDEEALTEAGLSEWKIALWHEDRS
jgi:hypothetical protein